MERRKRRRCDRSARHTKLPCGAIRTATLSGPPTCTKVLRQQPENMPGRGISWASRTSRYLIASFGYSVIAKVKTKTTVHQHLLIFFQAVFEVHEENLPAIKTQRFEKSTFFTFNLLICEKFVSLIISKNKFKSKTETNFKFLFPTNFKATVFIISLPKY